MNLSQIYKILDWHKNSRDKKEEGYHVGLFSPLPEDIAKQFPEDGKEGEDTSPPHITVLYIGDLIDLKKQKNLIDVVERGLKLVDPFEVKLEKPNHFINDDKQKVIHSPVSGKGLFRLHSFVKKILDKSNIPYSDKYPEYKPHVTIEYVNEGEKEKYGKLKPQGKWIIDNVWIWGTQEPHMISLVK